jgi:hypothetical protein
MRHFWTRLGARESRLGICAARQGLATQGPAAAARIRPVKSVSIGRIMV